MTIFPPIRVIRLATVLLTLLAAQVRADSAWPYPGWQDSNLTRIKAQALLQTLEATLLSQPSATVTLHN